MIRDTAEAYKSGDGDGYFCPKGYPWKYACSEGFAVNYKMPDGNKFLKDNDNNKDK